MLDVIVTAEGGAVTTDFLVDSGCPYNIMSFPFSRRLGVELEHAGSLMMAGGSYPVEAAMVSLIVKGSDLEPLRVRMGFVKPWKWPFGGILGQRGFFDVLLLAFDRKNLRFKLDLI